MMTSGERNEPRSVARRPRAGGTLAAIALAVLGGCSGGKGVNDPANELPFGHVDSPVPGAEVKAESPAYGWALDDRGITDIRIYVDGHLINSGALNVDRPDVSKAYPRYNHAHHKHGWTLLMGFDVPGPHTIVVQAVDTDGATRDIGTIAVTSVDK